MTVPRSSKVVYLVYVNYICNCVKVKVAQLCPTLCDPMDYTVNGILQARILEQVAVPFSRGSSQPRVWTQVSYISGRFFTSWATREAHVIVWWFSCKVVFDSCNPLDCSLPGSSAHGILQGEWEWVAISFSRGSFQPRDWTWVSCIAGRCNCVHSVKDKHSNSVIITYSCSYLSSFLDPINKNINSYSCYDLGFPS